MLSPPPAATFAKALVSAKSSNWGLMPASLFSVVGYDFEAHVRQMVPYAYYTYVRNMGPYQLFINSHAGVEVMGQLVPRSPAGDEKYRWGRPRRFIVTNQV